MLHVDARHNAEPARQPEQPGAAPDQHTWTDFSLLRMPPPAAGLGPSRYSVPPPEENVDADYSRVAWSAARCAVAVGAAAGSAALLVMTSPFWGSVALGSAVIIGGTGWLIGRFWKKTTEECSALQRDLDQVASSKQEIVRSAVKIRRSPVEGAAEVATLALSFCLKLDKLAETVRQDPQDYPRTAGLLKNAEKIKVSLTELADALGARTKAADARENAVANVRHMLREALVRYDQTYEEIHQNEFNRVETSARTALNVMDAYAPRKDELPEIKNTEPEPELRAEPKRVRRAMKY